MSHTLARIFEGEPGTRTSSVPAYWENFVVHVAPPSVDFSMPLEVAAMLSPECDGWTLRAKTSGARPEVGKVHVWPPSVDLMNPIPSIPSIPSAPSPVPTYRICGLDGATATAPIERLPRLSVNGDHVAPP